MERILLVTKALADSSRLRVVNALMVQKELCACQITELLELSGATISRHMGILIRAGLVKSRREGKWVHYSLGDNPDNVMLLRWIAAGMREASQSAQDLKTLKKITSQSLCGN